jgi:hypothetical protein
MGVLAGIANYYELGISEAMLYDGSGHAFIINVHKELCPSGPYCWKYYVFHRLAGNLGIDIIDHEFFSTGSSAQNRAKLESTLIEWLDKNGAAVGSRHGLSPRQTHLQQLERVRR